MCHSVLNRHIFWYHYIFNLSLQFSIFCLCLCSLAHQQHSLSSDMYVGLQVQGTGTLGARTNICSTMEHQFSLLKINTMKAMISDCQLEELEQAQVGLCIPTIVTSPMASQFRSMGRYRLSWSGPFESSRSSEFQIEHSEVDLKKHGPCAK